MKYEAHSACACEALYVRRNKSDQVDAAAIYEAMSRPGQRFVPARSIDNQAELMHHRARELLAGQRHGGAQCFARPSGRDRPYRAAGRLHHAYGLEAAWLLFDGFNENGEIVVPDCVRGALRSLISQIEHALDEAIGADRQGACGVGQGGRDGQAVDEAIPGDRPGLPHRRSWLRSRTPAPVRERA